jgi:hypothetical protein
MTGWRRPTWWDIGPDELAAVPLPDEQRDLMVQALHQWGGPTRPTDTLARAMGFANREAIHREGRRIREALAERQPLTMRDWARALVATEFVFASSYYGAAGDWEAVTGWTDEQTLPVLRALQHTLGGLRAPSRHGSAEQKDPFAER